MQITEFDRDAVHDREPDAEGSFSQVYLLPDAALKVVSTAEDRLSENVEVTDEFSPETVYEAIDDAYLVKQDKADWIYRPQDREELEQFMEDTAHIVGEAVDKGLALDFKPTNFGNYDGEPLYFDNSDIISLRPMDDPRLGMATQLEETLGNEEYYQDEVPDREEIMGYWG